jgi:dehydrogenase/reductase SDR family protein 7B
VLTAPSQPHRTVLCLNERRFDKAPGMSQRFQDRVIWITGASSGIGASLARVLSAQGAVLILSARRRERLEALAADLPGPSLILPLDLTDAPTIPPAVAEAVAWKGRLDILINNAGISQRALVEESDLSTVRRVMEINFFAIVDLTSQVLPTMLAQKSGHIVNMSSVAGYVATPMRSAYSASKHALRAWSDSLRAEVSGRGLSVTTICPGYVRTEISRSALRGDGSAKGTDDGLIANGMDATVAATKMATAIHRRRREFFVGGKEIYAVYLKRWLPGLVAWAVPRASPE